MYFLGPLPHRMDPQNDPMNIRLSTQLVNLPVLMYLGMNKSLAMI